ncbi:MAG: hypothetical protein M5R41_10310 [Bacteroidia bacterium]|nr:hypothetical protein [Bacteroidia bacterium]
MPNILGNDITGAIDRAGWSKVEILLTRGVTPTWTKVMPSGGGDFVEEAVQDRGLDGVVDVHYYKQRLTLLFYQADIDTLNDIYSEEVLPQLQVTGVTVRLWRLDGVQVIECAGMRFALTPQGRGYESAFHVLFEGESASLMSVFREIPPEPEE